MLGNANAPGIQEAYEEACREHGHPPGPTMFPDRNTPSVVFVAEDVDQAWKEIGEHLLHDVRTYAAWNPGDETTAGFSHVNTIDELRETGTSHVIISVPEAISRVKAGQVLNLSPLCGAAAGHRLAVSQARGRGRTARGARPLALPPSVTPLTAERRVMVENKRFRRNNSTLAG